MADGLRLTHTTAIILQAVHSGYIYGYTIMEATGLPSGTVYPALRRLETEDLVRSSQEDQAVADAELRPPRKYYRLTAAGNDALDISRKRFPLLARLTPVTEGRDL